MSDPSTQAGGAGWHPDPSGQHELRYWDGQGWTESVSDAGQQSTDPVPAAPPVLAGGVPQYAGASYGQAGRGPVGRTTNPVNQILLTIITLGIWAFVWSYRQYEDFKKYSGLGLGGAVGLVLAIFVSPVTYFMIPIEAKSNLYELDGEASPVQWTVAFWALIPIIGGIIWYVKVQAAINDFWIRRGASAP